MATMKAITFSEHGGIDVLKYSDVEKPTAGEGLLLIKNEYAGVSSTKDPTSTSQTVPGKHAAVLWRVECLWHCATC